MQPMNTNENIGLRATITTGTEYQVVLEDGSLSPVRILDHDVDARALSLEEDWEVYFVPEFNTLFFVRPDDYQKQN